MKRLIVIFCLFIPFVSSAQYALNGKVFNAKTNAPLANAILLIDNSFNAGFSDLDGNFRLNKVLENKVDLIISHIGFQTDTISVNLEKDEDVVIYLEPMAYHTDEVIVNSTRVNRNSAATSTDLSADEIAKNNLGQDITYLVQQSPSVVSTSDGGTGIGYTGIRIRGSDASRINVTINGVPLNDPESHGVFWVNMPDFASSLNSIQIQRGIGTSTNGAGAFGASINLETNTLNTKSYGEINNSVGFLEEDGLEYNSRKHTLKFGSGLINNQFAFEGRLSNIQSEGFIDRASADLKSYFLSGTYYGEKTIIKAISFGGKEVTYQSWFGTPQSRVENDRAQMLIHASNNGLSPIQTQNLLNSGRSYNYYTYDNQVDNYNQDHYQLHFSHQFSDQLTGNLSLHYTKGMGYFEEFKEDESFSDYKLNNVVTPNDTIESTDLIRRRWLDNDFYGLTYSVLYQANKRLKFNLGGAINNYEGDHFGQVIWAKYSSNSFLTNNYYFSESDKMDGNVYLKTSFALDSSLTLFGDLQVRRIVYQTKGTDNDQRILNVNENFTFFNPKVGANYTYNPNLSFYLFGGIGNREPNRADYTDQPANTPKKDANKAERMYNVELGVDYINDKYALALNYYLMSYENQLVITGQLNDVGDPFRQNVDKSYRTGVEFQGKLRLTKNLSWALNATFSENKIKQFTEKTYDYTTGFDIIDSVMKNSDIALSPNIIASSELSYEIRKGVDIALISRYVGEQFLDNTSNKNKMIDAYLVNDLRIQAVIPQKLFSEVKVQLLVNNIFSEEYSSKGYTYSYISGQKITENFYFPQALRNYLVGVSLKF